MVYGSRFLDYGWYSESCLGVLLLSVLAAVGP